MKRFAGLIIIISASILVSCDSDKLNEEEISFQYEATVKGKGLDCGDTYKIELRSINDSINIDDGIYYADNLDSAFEIEDLEILLNCREPNEDEIYSCTMMGPTYPHVIIIDCIINDKN